MEKSERNDLKKDPASVPRGTVPSLELVRGLASLDVFVYHFFLVNKLGHDVIGKLFGWAGEAVIVFFVLSGYVIGVSQQRKHRSPGEFFKARVRRIYPIYLVAIAIALLVGAILHFPAGLWQLVGHLIFLQNYYGSFVPLFPANPPLWSLGTEFEFYTAFTLCLWFGRRWSWGLWWWCGMAALVVRNAGYSGSGFGALVLGTLSLSPCWLIGYFVSNWKERGSFSILQALTIFLMIPMSTRATFGYEGNGFTVYDPLRCLAEAVMIIPLIHTLAVRHFYPEAKPVAHGWLRVGVVFVGFSIYAIIFRWAQMSVMLTFIAIPILVAVVGVLWQRSGISWPIRGPALQTFSIRLGGASYALYVMHTPLLLLVKHYTKNYALQVAILLPLVGISVYFLEYVAQPKMAARLDRLWGRPKSATGKKALASAALPN